MTAQDVNKLLALLKANYSYAFKTMTKQEKVMLVQSWSIVLRDVDVDLALMATMKLISTSKWMPTVAEIREKVQSIYYEAYGELLAINSMRQLYGDDEITGMNAEREKMLNNIADRAGRLRGDTTEISLKALIGGDRTARLEDGMVQFMLTDAPYPAQEEDE